MGENDGRVVTAGDEPDHSLVQIGRFELRGAAASRFIKAVLCGVGVLLLCVPGAAAFFAYAEGGTSLWAAIAFAVLVPGCVSVWLFRDTRGIRKQERRFRAR